MSIVFRVFLLLLVLIFLHNLILQWELMNVLCLIFAIEIMFFYNICSWFQLNCTHFLHILLISTMCDLICLNLVSQYGRNWSKIITNSTFFSLPSFNFSSLFSVLINFELPSAQKRSTIKIKSSFSVSFHDRVSRWEPSKSWKSCFHLHAYVN